MHELQPDPDQQQIQARARAFAQQEVAPLAREADERGEFPLHLVRRMGELGFLAGPIGPEYGGQGLDYLSFALVYEELGRADSSVRGFLAVHAGLVSLCIRDWGSPEQRRRYLPRLASGEWIGCYCLTEPNAGSDAASMETTVREEVDGYVLNGEKIWITNGNIANLAIVFATARPGRAPPRHLRLPGGDRYARPAARADRGPGAGPPRRGPRAAHLRGVPRAQGRAAGRDRPGLYGGDVGARPRPAGRGRRCAGRGAGLP